MSLKIRTRKHKDIPVVSVEGEVTFKDVARIRKKLDTAFSRGGHSSCVLDLEKVQFIDSHGIGLFLYMWKVLKEHDRSLIFLNPQGFVKQMFEQTNLDRYMKFIFSLEEL